MRILAVLALSVTLLTGACTTPDGQFDPGSTFGLAAGLAAIGGVAYLVSQSNDGGAYHSGRGDSYGYRGGGGYSHSRRR